MKQQPDWKGTIRNGAPRLGELFNFNDYYDSCVGVGSPQENEQAIRNCVDGNPANGELQDLIFINQDPYTRMVFDCVVSVKTYAELKDTPVGHALMNTCMILLHAGPRSMY